MSRAMPLLEQAAASRPRHARARAALGYCYDLQGKAPQRRELARAKFPADAYSLVVNGFVRAGGVRRLPARARAQLRRLAGARSLIRALDAKAGLMQRWLDTFDPGSMSSEAAAFMYLAEGVEEIRGTDD